MANILLFLMNSFFLGVADAMDAFSVSIANAIMEPNMAKSRKAKIAGVFGVFQFAMPMIGWFCVHTIAEYFLIFKKYIPLIALVLLVFLGGKMLLEGFQEQKSPSVKEQKPLRKRELFVQGIATSIDALSVGFAIASYTAPMAFVAALIIGIVTFFICEIGLSLGMKFGTKLAGRATIVGGIILILIGIEIFFTA